MRPARSRKGETVTEKSSRRPSREMRTVSKWSMRSPLRMRARMASSSPWRSGGMTNLIDWPIASSAE